MMRVVSLVLACTVIFSLILGGCTGKEKAQVSTKEDKVQEPQVIKWAGVNQQTFYPGEDSYVVQELNKIFNVKLKIIKASITNDQELNLLFASGEIPNHFLVSETYMPKVLDAGLSREISEDMLKKAAPDYLKLIQKNLPDYKNLPVYKNGKFLALPEYAESLLPISVIRTDWLEKVGAKMPTNLDEFQEVCRLFAEGDPDGNGKKDTYAMSFALQSATGVSQSNCYNIFASFGITPPAVGIPNESWVKDANGKLARVQVTEKYKQALKYIANLYKRGYIHPDVTDTKSFNDRFTNGVVGMHMGGFTAVMPKYRPTEWYAMTFKKNPNAKAAYMAPMKGPGGQDAQYELQTSIWRYACVGKDTTDAQLEAILKILNAQFVDDNIANLVWRGKEGTHYSVNSDGMALMNKEFEPIEKLGQMGFKFFVINMRSDKQKQLSFGNEYSELAKFQEQFKTFNQLLPVGMIFTESSEYSADVRKIQDEFMVNAVTGVWDVDKEWDRYISNWNKAGGDKITAEANKMYQAAQKK